MKWFKKLFNIREYDYEYVGTIEYRSSFIWSNTYDELDAVVYKKVDKETKEVVAIFANIPGHGARYFDINAWKREGKLVER